MSFNRFLNLEPSFHALNLFQEHHGLQGREAHNSTRKPSSMIFLIMRFAIETPSTVVRSHASLVSLTVLQPDDSDLLPSLLLLAHANYTKQVWLAAFSLSV